MEISDQLLEPSIISILSTFGTKLCENFLRDWRPMRIRRIAYPLLRVEIQEVEIERVRGFPPRLLRPASVEPFDLEIHGHLCPSRTAKAADLTKLAT